MAAALLLAPGSAKGQAESSDSLVTIPNEAVAEYRSAQGMSGEASGSASVMYRPGEAEIDLSKSADRDVMGPGDTITYRIAWENVGNGPAHDVEVVDEIPDDLEPIDDPLSISDDEVEASWGNDQARLTLLVPHLDPGGEGEAELRLRARSSAEGEVENVASVTWSGTDNSSSSGVVTTPVREPELELSMELLEEGPFRVGDDIDFRLKVENASKGLTARDLAVTDSLPPVLEYRSADPEPGEMSGTAQSSGDMASALALSEMGSEAPLELVWEIEQLEGGEAKEIILRTRLVHFTDEPIENVGWLSSRDDSLIATAAATLAIDSTLPIQISKEASSSGVAQGERIGFLISGIDDSPILSDDLVVEATLPDGIWFDEEGVQGGTLISATDSIVQFHPEVASDGSFEVAYTAIALPDHEGMVESEAYAIAGGGRSDPASAAVSVQPDRSLHVQAIMGEVVDQHGDPVPHARVWLSSGDYVYADQRGGFMFEGVLPGRYMVRLDPRSLASSDTVASGDDVRLVDMDGYSVPRVAFRVEREAPEGAEQDASRPRTLGDLGVSEEDDGVAVDYPAPGSLVTSPAVFLRVEGALPGTSASAWIDDGPVEGAEVWPDGAVEFFVPTEDEKPGPMTLSVAVEDSSGEGQVKSLPLHRPGPPRVLEVEGAPEAVHAHERASIELSIRDEWGEPASPSHLLDVDLDDARLLNADASPDSRGHQVQADGPGHATIEFLPMSTGDVTLDVSAEKAEYRTSFEVGAERRPLTLLGHGEVTSLGGGAAEGQVFAVGDVRDETTLTLSAVSSPDREYAGRLFDGTTDSFRPGGHLTTGDRSQSGALRVPDDHFFVRLDHRSHWLQYGRLEPLGQEASLRLGRYGRSLSGVQGHFGGERFNLTAFGASSGQSLRTANIPADGSTGPFSLGFSFRPGTDQAWVEVRDRDNAERVLSRNELERFRDYRVDPESGTLLLERTIPSTDGSGNPLYLVVLAESRHDGSSSVTGGARAEVELLSEDRGVTVGGGGVEDRSPYLGHQVLSSDASIRLGSHRLAAEAAHSSTADSSGVAARLSADIELPSRAAPGRLSAEWLEAGEGFHNPGMPSITQASRDVRIDGRFPITPSLTVGGGHQHQDQASFGTRRNRSHLDVEVPTGSIRWLAQGALASDRIERGEGDSQSREQLQARLEASHDSGVRSWLEGETPLESSDGEALPDVRSLTLGTSLPLFGPFHVDSRIRTGTVGDESFQTADVRLGGTFDTGTSVWTSGDMLFGEDDDAGAVSFGLEQSLSLGSHWSIRLHGERWRNVSDLPSTDPARRLPVLDETEDRTVGSMGLTYSDRQKDRGFDVQSEASIGEHWRSRRTLVNAEIAPASGWGLLLRGDASDRTSRDSNPDVLEPCHLHALLGLAIRPLDRINLLVRGEFKDERGPTGITGATGTMEDRRVLFGVDAALADERGFELSGRAAIRSRSQGVGPWHDDEALGSTNYLFGSAIGYTTSRDISVGVRGRGLLNDDASASDWSLSPYVRHTIGGSLYLEAGYNFGSLVDPDFLHLSDTGHYLSGGVMLTESVVTDFGRFWSGRLGF